MNITTNLLNLQPLIINNFKESENNITFFVSTRPSPQICPHCGAATSRIHAYRNQILLKEASFKFRETKTQEEAEHELHNWLIWAESTEMEEFQTCITAFHNWSSEIINSIVYGYNNGYTEGTNNLIKAIKRNAYGYHKFENLRKRIFLVSSKKNQLVAA